MSLGANGGAAALDDATDDDLVRRSAAGDRLAFARIVERHRGQVMAVAGRIVFDRAAAEEIVQEVFLRAWTRAGDWRSGSGPGRARYSTWLARIAVNLAIDGKRRIRPVALESVAEPPDPAPGADERLIQRERAERMQLAVMDLPERQRAAIALSYDAGLSNAEAADALGTSVGAVELLLVRARRALRAAMVETEE